MNEKEAIERVEKYIKSFNGNAWDCVAIGTVLTLLEKYKKDYISTSKRTNEYKKAIECEKCNCSVCQAHLNNIELQAELEKKDKESHFIQSELDIANAKIIKLNKMIDLMAYDIATNDSDLCQYINETIRCKKYAGENKLTCDECIKQYYERKVENGN